MTSVSSALLSVNHLSVGYPSERGFVQAVNDVSFELFENECIALIGESGSGKSTLGQSLVRLLPRSTQIRGDVTLRSSTQEKNVMTLTERELRTFRWRSIAYVTQSAISAFNPLLRISAHFTDTAQAHGAPLGHALQSSAFSILHSVRLEPARVWNAYPHELSGGMRQRVLLALALILEPQVLVLDEPTTALDVLTQRAIVDVLLGLRSERKVSMIFISHDLGVAAEIADRLFTMYAGRIIERGTVGNVLGAPSHPYTEQLLLAIPPLQTDRTVSSIPGTPPDLVQLPSGCAFHPRCQRSHERCTRGDAPAALEVEPGHVAACHDAEEVHRVTGERWSGHD